MKHQASFERREMVPRAPRVAIVFDTVVRSAAGDLPAKLLNVSAAGFRLRSRKPLAPGLHVTLLVARSAPVRGIIRWTEGRDSGGVFADPVAL